MVILKLKCKLREVNTDDNDQIYKDIGIDVNEDNEVKDGFVYINPEYIESFFKHTETEINLSVGGKSYIVSYTSEEFLREIKGISCVYTMP